MLHGKMEQTSRFVDMLKERRKDCDFLWVTRPMDPLVPHILPSESIYTRDEVIKFVLLDTQVRAVIDKIVKTTGITVQDVEKSARIMINEMASKADLATVRWLGISLNIILDIILNSLVFIVLYLNNYQVSVLV